VNRRQLLKSVGIAAGGGGIALLGDTFKNGVRFPIVQGDPKPSPTRLELLNPKIVIQLHGAYIQHAEHTESGLGLEIRAFEPQPTVFISSEKKLPIDILVRNVSVSAELASQDVQNLKEQRDNTVVRRLSLTASTSTELRWHVPFVKNFSFAAIGDSGGGSEFAWCLERCKEMDVDFLLHLGDIFYTDTDIATVGAHLDNSTLPIYAAIGNHDFQRLGTNLHDDFRRQIGPQNSHFRLGDSVIVNFDTAAGMWPANAGMRNQLFERIGRYSDEIRFWVFMTHRPMHDPRSTVKAGEGHVLPEREHDYILSHLKKLEKYPVLLAGHIHTSTQVEEQGIKTIISGEGLATRNIAAGDNVARILVGDKNRRGFHYHWEKLNTPKHSHCHYKADSTRRLMGLPSELSGYGEYCDEVLGQ
jgi:predicted phosphodiesterase